LDRERFVPILFSQSICNKNEAEDKLSLKKPIETILFSISVIKDSKDSLKNADLLKFERITITKFKDIQNVSVNAD
jgi:hypothetical protein